MASIVIVATAALSPHIRMHGPRAHVRMQQDPPPPELDERQAAFMRQRGFQWNGKTRAWVKGDPARAQRLECRSGARVLRWDESLLSEQSRPCIRQVTLRFQQALREAREEALGAREEDRRIALQIKDKIAQSWAPFAWLGVQLSCFAILLTIFPPILQPPNQQELLDVPLIVPLAIGAAFAPVLSILRRERWRRLPGVEDGDGALERLLVDAQLGSFALPAPWAAIHSS